eukprot:Gb_41309 [translate_table: standard]
MLDPCLGFSSEEVEIPGLAEGLIFPEQEELSVHRRLFQNNQKRGDGTLDLRSGEPSFIRILVGTKEAVEIWLKSSGPACCALWIEVAEIQMEFRVPDEARKALNGELQLAYRLRLYSALFCSVLKGVTFRLSPYWKKHRSSSENRTRVPPHSRSKLESLRQKEKERFLRSVGITHLGDDFCAKAGKAQGTALPKKQWIRKWLAKIPVEAFKQLLTMLSTGGALFEFQQVLLRIVHIPYFLDVNFHLVDVLDWLRSHRFVVLLEGLDLVVAAQGLKWSIIRFSFVEGFIKIAADDSLSSLLQIFGLREENASRSYDSSPGVEFPKADSYLKTYGTTNDSETSFNSLTWEAWEPSPKEQDSLQAGLRRTGLLDGMLLQGSDSFLEFLWDDFNPIFPKLTEVQRAVKKHPKASQSMVLELKPICFIPSVRLSSKEKCALCNLGSSDRTVRQRGIRFLLRLMQRGTRNSSTKPSARRSSRSLNDKVQSAPIPDKLLTCLQKHLKYNGICSSSEDILIEGEHKPVENSQKRQSLQQTAVSEGVIVTRGTANDAVEIVRIEGLSSTLAHGNQARTGSTEWRDDNRETEKAGFNSQPCSSRFIDRSESNQSNLFEESTYDHSGVLTDDREFSLNFETIWSRLSEWVQNGFTDALITELIMAKRNGSTKEDKWLNVQELTNTCLQVIAILPGEGSYHMVQSLKKSLENCIQEHNVLSAGNFCEKGRCSMLLKNDQDIEGGPSDVAALHFQKLPRYEKVQEACWRTWRLGRILYIILQRSTITSALLAECGGLDLILELYSCLVKNLLANRIHLGHTSFRFNAANDHGPSLLPGEVSEKEKVTSKVFPFFNAISLLVGAQKSAPRKAFKECCSVVDGQSDGNFTGNTKSSVESFAKSCFRDESSSANRNIQKLIFEVVFLLDNDDIYFKQSQYRKVQKTDHLTWSSLGPPAEQLLGSFSYHLLMEISEQLKTVLADWCQLLPDYGLDNDHKDLSTGGSSDGRQSYEGSNSLFLYKAAYHWRGICSSLWAYLSILLRILTVYIDSSPKDAAGGVLFKSCGEHIESVFHLLAASDGSPTWSHPQRQALQSLLSLFQASLQDCMQDRNPALAGWSDFEELFWQMTVKNKLHWEFMKNCLNWVVLKSCHGCRRSLVGTSHNSIVEPARIQLGTPEETKVLSSPCQDTDILKSSIKWISSVVHLIQRKIDAQNAFLQDSLFLFSPGQMLCLLDFLMNPVEGMVMKTFKDSFSCHKVVKRQVSHGLPFIQEESTCHAAPSPSCQGLASSQTTVSFSSNLSHKTMLGSTSSSSEIEWPQHRNKQLNSSSEMDDTHEAEINSDMNYNINPCPVDHGICHQQQCLPVYALEELPRKLCRSCTKLTSAQLLCDEMSFLIQQEIASLSAEIFTVRFCGSSRQDYILAVKQKSAIENPFLSSTYVDPFLEYHFLGLSQLYSQETQQWGPPKDQIELDSTDCESSKVEDSNPDCRVETLATTMNSEDEKVTATCLRHVAVLLALAQNQTEYVSQKFKQLKVMDFLLKQITLEYESSNVATPRDLYTESRDHNVFEATNIKKVMNEENGCGTVGFLQNKQNCIQDHMQSQSLLQIKEYSADHKLKGHELKEAVRLAIVEAAFSNPEKDCLSAKTDSNSTGQTSFDIPNYGAPRLSHNSSDELDVQCCVSNPDNRIENVLGFEINKEGEFLHENNIFCKDECGNLHYNTDEFSDGSHARYGDVFFYTGDFWKTSLIDGWGNMHCIVDQYSDGSCARYGDVFFYSGRFFDLNEEVERELAEEEILIGLAEGNEASDSSALKDSSRQEEVNEDTSTGDLVAVRVHSQLEDDNETFCSGKEGSETIVLKSLDEFENSVLHPGKKQSVRSVVPKLNLPKSARKGDQESVTSNDSVDREFVKMSADIGHMKKLSMQGLCSRSTPEDLMNISIWQEKTSSMTYETERSKRRIYRNTNLHLSLLELFVSLMLTPQYARNFHFNFGYLCLIASDFI